MALGSAAAGDLGAGQCRVREEHERVCVADTPDLLGVVILPRGIWRVAIQFGDVGRPCPVAADRGDDRVLPLLGPQLLSRTVKGGDEHRALLGAQTA